ncbi:MAG: hypothetical protein H0T79_21250 [Deltaproteobacteria bacterium]|nr:hypothetical protein [Deltaproteobacteria bacterium]
MVQILDVGTAQLYARALLAIARADEPIGSEEGMRLESRLAARVAMPMPIADLLLADPLDPSQLARDVRLSSGPFRNVTLHSSELARMIVLDSIIVLLAKGYVSEAEGLEVIRFAIALGCTRDEVRGMSVHLANWI